MKLQRLLSVTVTIATALTAATVATFAQEQQQEVTAACADQPMASFSLVPALVATLVVPAAILAARHRFRTKR